MSPNSTPETMPEEAPVAVMQCSPSHRRMRRALTGVVLLLAFAIVALTGYCIWSSSH